jgi:hypothetical protein
MAGESRTAVYAALAGNAAIAVVKGVVAMLTGSSAMLAEMFHSIADTGNEGLLLLGMRLSKRAPDQEHPFGHGMNAYFWAFVVFDDAVHRRRRGCHLGSGPHVPAWRTPRPGFQLGLRGAGRQRSVRGHVVRVRRACRPPADGSGAKKLEVEGRFKMSKRELARAIGKKG